MAASLAQLSPRLRWSLLIGASGAAVILLEALRIPAALLIGPMVVAVAMAVNGGAVRPPRPIFIAAQGVVGTMIATTLPMNIGQEILREWPVFLAGVASTLFASAFLGWLMARSGTLPGTTAIWGTSPGAATVMTLMSASYGADMRLVAFMQYLRVALCVAFATVMVSLMTPAHAGSTHTAWWPDAATWREGSIAIIIALAGAAAGVRLRWPGGPMMVPMAMAIIAKLVFHMPVTLPLPVLVVCYAVIGWGIGMRFVPETLTYARRVFWRVLGSIVLLIVICGVFAMGLVVVAGTDPLTAFLATSPGGADSVAIISSSTDAGIDVAFVMSMQVTRFFVVVLAGPPLARLLSRGHRS